VIKPYYSEGGIEIYHGDCREILPTLARADLLLADPPYGMDVNTAWRDRKPGRWAKDRPPVVGDDAAFDPRHLLGAAGHHVIFGANWFSHHLPPASCWISWDKRQGGTLTPGWNASDAELAWTDFDCGVRVFAHLWEGYKRASEIGFHVHPTQKPVALMAWIIDRWTEPGWVVLDPYLGSGTTLRAAKNLGRRAIGIEIEERYCEIAAKRLGQEVMDFGAAA
jgi:site-specific DNA-methyltransferase (adenine-specific)/modification methylase